MSSISIKINELEKEVAIVKERLNDINKEFNDSDKTLNELINTYMKEKSNIRILRLTKRISLNRESNIRYENIKSIYKEKIKEYNVLMNVIKNIIMMADRYNINLNIKRPFFKLAFDRKKEPIILLVDLERELDGGIKSFRILGIDSDSRGGSSYFDSYLEAHIHLINQYSKGIVAFLSKIDIKRNYRSGRGTLIMKFIELEVLQEIQKYMKDYYSEQGYPTEYGEIKRIDGYIASISVSSLEENMSFYKSLGYTIIKKNMSKKFSS